MDFIRGYGGRVAHIGTLARGRDRYSNDVADLICGTSFERWTTPEKMKVTDSRYPTSIDGVCLRCAKKDEGKEFLKGITYRIPPPPPKMVETKVSVDIRIPKVATIDDVEALIAGLSEAVEKHREVADTMEFVVKVGK